MDMSNRQMISRSVNIDSNRCTNSQSNKSLGSIAYSESKKEEEKAVRQVSYDVKFQNRALENIMGCDDI